MDGDINQVTLLVLGFLTALGLLIFGMDWLEDRIDAPPSRFTRWLRSSTNRGGPSDAGPAAPGPEEPSVPIPRQRSADNAPVSPLSSALSDAEQALGSPRGTETPG